MPPALLAAAYMATSAQKDALDAQESPPLPGPWTLMTVRVLKRYGVLHPYPLPSLWRSSPGQIRNFSVDATAS